MAEFVDATLMDLKALEMPPHLWGRAQEAVAVAQRSGSGAAMARALLCRAHYLVRDHRANESLRDAEASYLLASQSGHTITIEGAAMYQAHALWRLGRFIEVADFGEAASKELFALGSSQWACYLASMAAEALLDLGRWAECDDILRDALSARHVGFGAADVRVISARLAARRGQSAIAQQHLDRAVELVPINHDGLDGRETLVEMLIARGDPKEALELFRPLLLEYLSGGVGQDTDGLLLWGARAAADLAEHARDRRDRDAEQETIHLLDELLAMAQATPLARPWLSAEGDLLWTAYRAVTVAETGRCRGSAGQAASWEHAASSCSAIGLRWQRRCLDGVGPKRSFPKARPGVPSPNRCGRLTPSPCRWAPRP